jgi:hypothetical protein
VRGGDERSGELFSYVDLEVRIRRDHPLRAIPRSVNEALSSLMLTLVLGRGHVQLTMLGQMMTRDEIVTL